MPDHGRFLAGRTAWVTGASRGIGRAIALSLARAGAVVCAAARNEDHLRQLSETAAAENVTIHPVLVDVSSSTSVARFGERAAELAGPPSILVNNAGFGLFRDIDQMEIADFDRQVDVTLKGPWYMAQQAVPHMKRLGAGHIVNIGSIAGRTAFKRGSAYCAAKGGLNLMSEALMLELREHGIKVSLIAPGSVDTAFHQQALPNANLRDSSWMLDPGTIAEAVLHLLSQPENALTGYYEVRPLKPGGK